MAKTFREEILSDFRTYDWLFALPSAADIRGLYEEEAEKLVLGTYDYRCPFDLLNEFDKWFEWHRRVHFKGQTTGEVTVSMLSHDMQRIMCNRIEQDILIAIRSTEFPTMFDKRRMIFTNAGD